jgi:hypothetical protein
VDLGKLLGAYGSTPSDLGWFADADTNMDNKINYVDLGFILARYGQHI